jgi:hypothetical protein
MSKALYWSFLQRELHHRDIGLSYQVAQISEYRAPTKALQADYDIF